MPKPTKTPNLTAPEALPALPSKRARRRSTRSSHSWRFRRPPSRKRVDAAKARFQPQVLLSEPPLPPLPGFEH